MKVQINNLGNIDLEKERKKVFEKIPPVIYSERLEGEFSEEKIRRECVYFYEREYTIGRVCQNCGAEIYGEWKYFYLSNNLKKQDRGYSIPNYGIIDEWSDDGWSRHDYIGCCSEKFYNNIETFTKEYNRAEQDIKSEQEKFKSMKKCPICNAELTNDKTYTESFDWSGQSDRIFEDINKQIAKLYQSQSQKNVADYINVADVKSYVKNTFKGQISTDMLKEYVLNLINLESDIMSLSKRLAQLYFQQLYNNRSVIFDRHYPLYHIRQDIDSKHSHLANSKIKLSEFKKQPINFKKAEYPEKPEYPMLKTPHFFNKKKVEAENAQTLKDYQSSLERYNSKVISCDAENEKMKATAEQNKEKKIKEYEDKITNLSNELTILENKLKQKSDNNNIPTKALGEKHLLDSEIKTVEETLKELFKCRNELYSYNIVFDKYRNIVALSTFYEYLMAGRCETLDGVNGAYNIYENELRLNMIITKLDEIKENQFMIYNKLRDIDSSLNTLNNTMEKAVSSLESINTNTDNMNKYLDSINKNTAVIAHNSAVTAYYSKINAELTNALGFMVALK